MWGPTGIDEDEFAMGASQAESRHCGNSNKPPNFPKSSKSSGDRKGIIGAKSLRPSRVGGDTYWEEHCDNRAPFKTHFARTQAPLATESFVECADRGSDKRGYRRIGGLSRVTSTNGEIKKDDDDVGRKISSVKCGSIFRGAPAET